MKLNIREMLAGSPVRLRYVNRYSTCRVNHKETVAEHSFFVCLYAALIARWVAWSSTIHPRSINWSILMLRAVVHDMEEASTGDWPRHFKHSSSDLLEMLESVAETAMGDQSEKLIGSRNLVEYWKGAKDNTHEGRIVAFADFLSVLSYVIQEYESGNANASEHIRDLDKYQAQFNDESFSFLRPLVDQSRELLEAVFADARRSVVANGTR